jgi:DNA-binding transcriptional regulator LsrR (DeoR family)
MKVRVNQVADGLIAEIAWLYHIKGLTQGEIAKKKELSRPTVISYLKLAKSRGIVSIKLDPLHGRVNELADQIRERFNIKTAYVVADHQQSDLETLEAVCEFAAHALPDFLDPNDQLGVSWGETLSIMANMVPFAPIPGLVVRQLIGSMANPLVMTAESCTTEIARRLDGKCVNLNAPAVCSNVKLAEALRNEHIISQQLERLRDCNKAVYSVSPCTLDTHVVRFKVSTREELKAYERRGAVCNLAGRFLDAGGNAVKGELDDRLLSVQLSDLRRMKGMLVVSGTHKATPAVSVLSGGYADCIVLDEKLAKAMLKIA